MVCSRSRMAVLGAVVLAVAAALVAYTQLPALWVLVGAVAVGVLCRLVCS